MWGQLNDGRTVYRVVRPAGGNQPAEYLAVGCACVGLVAVRNAGAAMTAALGTVYGVGVALIIYWLFLDEDWK